MSEALDEDSPITEPQPLPRPPRKTSVSAQKAGADGITAAKPKPRRPATKPRAKAPVTKPAVVDPGPPPPLPADLVDALMIPPKPPLPLPVSADDAAADEPVVDAAPVADAEPVDAEPVVESEPMVDAAPVVDAEPVDAESVVDAAPLVEAEPVVEAEPMVDSEPVVDETPAEALIDAPETDDPRKATPVDDAPGPDADDVDALLEIIEPVRGDLPASFATPGADGGVAALSLRGIRKSFGATRAVDDIDLTVPAGTFYGLVGPNGAGKTTTLSMIAGLLRPDRGSLVVGGVDATAHPVEAKKLMGVLPDRLRTFDRLTGRQLLYYYGVLRGLKPAVVESRTADLARAFDLTDALGRVVSDYSAGMAKKVMLAGAMIHSPRLLVLDEPFESVDPVSSAIILDILSAYVAHGGTVILSSHGMELVERVCSRVAVLVAGQVLAEGTVAEVRGELTLEQRFIELAGGLSDVEGLEWLHTFSD